MSSFTEEILLSELASNWRLWRIERDFTYDVGALGSGRRIVVPAGFLTDGASVPKIFWSVLPCWGTYSRAAIVHDYLCWRLHQGAPHAEAPTRRAADAVFYEAMLVAGTGPLTARILWAGVRVGALLNRLFPHNPNIVDQVNPRG